MPRDYLLVDSEFLQRLAGHDPGGELGQRPPGRLGDKRRCPAGPRVDLDEINLAVLDGKLDIHQAADTELQGQGPGLAPDLVNQIGAEGIRRQCAGRIPGMDSGLLDVLHDAADDDVSAVGQGVDVDLDGVLEELVHQNRVLRRSVDGKLHVVSQLFRVVDDLHGAPTKDIGRTDNNRVADIDGNSLRLFERPGYAVIRLFEIELVQQLLEALPVFGPVNRVRAGADNRYALFFERDSELERRLPAELHDNSVRFLRGDDLQYILEG